MAAGAPGAGGRRTGSAALWVVSALRHPLVLAVVRRLVVAIPLLLVVSALVFLLLSVVPGDVTETILGNKQTSGVPPQTYEDLAHELGVDRPWYEQYWNWLSAAVKGDLGQSIVTRQPVTQSIGQRFPITLSLTVGALLLSLVVGVGLGVTSAVRGGGIGRAVDALAMIGWVVPVFWLAAELVVIFAVKLRWFPAIGYVPFEQSPVQWFRSLVLPVVALSIGAIGGFAKFTRESMLDVLASEHVRMSRANGIPRRAITFRYALKPASLQVVTFAGLLVVGLLIGTVFVETVFGIPGMGSLIVNGANGHDLPMVQGVAVFFTLIVIVVNLFVDLAYGLLSPKVRAA